MVLEFETLKKISSEGYRFSFPLETVFKVRSPLLDPGAVEGNSARLRRLHGLRKRNAPGGRAPPPRTNPERASNFRGYHVVVFVDGLKDLNIYVLVVHFLLSAKPGTRQSLVDRCTFGARSRRWRSAAQSPSLPQFMGRARSCTVAFSCSRVKQVWTNPQSVVETLLSTRYIFRSRIQMSPTLVTRSKAAYYVLGAVR